MQLKSLFLGLHFWPLFWVPMTVFRKVASFIKLSTVATFFLACICGTCLGCITVIGCVIHNKIVFCYNIPLLACSCGTCFGRSIWFLGRIHHFSEKNNFIPHLKELGNKIRGKWRFYKKLAKMWAPFTEWFAGGQRPVLMKESHEKCPSCKGKVGFLCSSPKLISQ